MKKQKLTILGATGSIGQSTLNVVRQHPDKFEVYALTAHHNWDGIEKLIHEFKPEIAVLSGAPELPNHAAAKIGKTVIKAGVEALCDVAAHPVDRVMAAIVGISGLKPVISAAKTGQKIMLANKESLICGGALLLDLARQNNTTIVPVDSEHNALFQIYDDARPETIEAITITASGGPFREWTLADMQNVTPEQAVAHPNWSMGAKISVDSATLMNKGLEVIEATYLFPAVSKIDVVVHKQSVIHGLVHYVDGTVKAVLSPPDMQSPIAAAMAHPERVALDLPKLDLVALGKLDFEAPDLERFPCLQLAYDALAEGLGAQVALNAANEVAVAKFLNREIAFTDIAKTVAQAMQNAPKINNFDDVFALDSSIREQLG